MAALSFGEAERRSMLCTMMHDIMRRSVLSAGVLTLAATVWWSSDLGAQAGATTTIDFRAVGADGAPIRDLKAEEVSIRIAGRQRAVKSLRLVERGGGSAGAPATAAVPPPFGTNSGGGPAGGRIVLIVVEDETLPAGGEVPVRQAIISYLDTLSPADRVAFAIAPRDTAATGFGAGIPKIKEALGSLSGRARGASSSERACRTRDTLLQLRAMLSAFSGAATPVIVLFFSSEMEMPSSGGGTCDLTTEQYQSLGTTAAAARAHFFVINSHNSVSGRNEGLETLASVSGAGTVQRLAGQQDLLSKIAVESSAYYEATVDAESSDRAGQSQRLDVRVSRQGADARFRPEIVLSASAAAKPGAKASPADMLRTTQAFTDLPVRTVGVPSRDTNGRIKVTVFSEAVDPSTKLTGGAVGLISAAGKFAPTQLEEKQLAGRPIVTAHSVEPGQYRLRFAAVDANGRGGAADYTVNAALTDAGALKMSGLLLFGGGDNAFSPRMIFTDEASAVGYLEIYGNVGAGPVSARMEIASSLDGPAIESVQPGGKTTSEADRFILTGQLSLAKLAPGDYVVRAFLKQGDGPEGRVVATLRKVQ
jgi:hypothetical protein